MKRKFNRQVPRSCNMQTQHFVDTYSKDAVNQRERNNTYMKNVKEQCAEMSASNGVQVVKVSSRSTYRAHCGASANVTFGMCTHCNVLRMMERMPSATKLIYSCIQRNTYRAL